MSRTILLLLVAFAGLFVETFSQNEYHSNGTSGEKCGKRHHQCVTTAKCKTSNFHCDCKPPLVGKGKLGCVRPGDAVAFLQLDPTLITFGGEHLNVPLPCRYKVVHYTMMIENHIRTSVEVYAENRLSKDGEYYVKNVLVSISVMTANEVGKHSIQFEGSATDGDYNFTTTVLEDSMTQSSLQTELDFTKYTIGVSMDYIDNFIVARIESVGLTVRFRPSTSANEDAQRMTPGVVMVIDREVIDSVKFVNGTISASPYGPSITTQSISFGFDVQLYLYLLAIYNTPAIIMDDHLCQELTVTFRNNCKNDHVRASLLKTCSSLYSDKAFLSCLYNNAPVDEKFKQHRLLFQYCVQSFCLHSTDSCQAMMKHIEDTKCELPSTLKDFKCSPEVLNP